MIQVSSGGTHTLGSRVLPLTGLLSGECAITPSYQPADPAAILAVGEDSIWVTSAPGTSVL